MDLSLLVGMLTNEKMTAVGGAIGGWAGAGRPHAARAWVGAFRPISLRGVVSGWWAGLEERVQVSGCLLRRNWAVRARRAVSAPALG